MHYLLKFPAKLCIMMDTVWSQHIKVNISSADKKSRKLVFSMKPKEKEEFVEKKRSLMVWGFSHFLLLFSVLLYVDYLT